MKQIVQILFLTILACSCSTRFVTYKGNSDEETDEFNAVVYKKKGAVELKEGKKFDAQEISINDTLLSWTDVKSGNKTGSPVSKVKTVTFNRKAGLPAAIPGFIGGLFLAPLFVSFRDNSEQEVTAGYILSGCVGAYAFSQISYPSLIYQIRTSGEGDSITNAGASTMTDSSRQSHDSVTVKKPLYSWQDTSHANKYKYTTKKINRTDLSRDNINDFNLLAYQRLGRVMFLDSSTWVGLNYHIADSLLTWSDLKTQRYMSVPLRLVQSIDIIKQSDFREKAGKSVSGMAIGALIGGLTGLLVSVAIFPRPPKVDDEGEPLEGPCAGCGVEVLFVPLGIIVGAIIGANVGSSAAEQDTKFSFLFNEPVGPKSKRRVEVGKAVALLDTSTFSASKTTKDEASPVVVKKETAKSTEKKETASNPMNNQTAQTLKNTPTNAGQKYTGSALARSTTNTAIPLLLGMNNMPSKNLKTIPIVYGLAVGPSIGHYYAKDSRRGLIGILVRGIGCSLYVAGNPGWGTILTGGGLIYSFYTTASSVREYNARQSWSVVPFISPGTKLAGLTLQFQM